MDRGIPGWVAFRTDEADWPIGVSRCFMHPEWARDSRHARDRASAYAGMAVGDRCGVLRYESEREPPAHTRQGDGYDLAVLQLDRPVPHRLHDLSRAGAGDVSVDPSQLGETPAGDFVATAVGEGGRRVARTFTAATASEHFIYAVDARFVGILEGGDSGGPVFYDCEGRDELVAVASTTRDWIRLTADKLGWIRSRLDTEPDGRIDTACRSRPSCAWLDGRGAHTLANADNDRDGDGYLDSEDNCPNTYNPCQEDTDIDGDGVLDGCDACPTDPAVAVERPALPDRDADRVPDACDCRPDRHDPLDWSPISAPIGSDRVTAGGDPDCDFIQDSLRPEGDGFCDNCLTAFNPFQEDRDGDGLGDACDRCVDEPDAFMDSRHTVAADRDGDGVPDACDNCVATANPLQADCNLDAELALWDVACAPGPDGARPCTFFEFLGFEGGDACDVTPCGETRVATETVGARTPQVIQNAVRVDARAATTREGRTGFRFCRCTAATRDSVDLRVGCRDEERIPVPDGEDIVLGNCGPLDTEAYDQGDEPPNWRWTTIAVALDPARPAAGRTPPATRVERNLSYQPGPEGYFATDLWAEWLLRDRDVPRWVEAFAEPISSGPLANLPGVFWTHTPGPPGGGDATEWERPRASHFDSGRARISTAPPVPRLPPFPCIVPITPFIGRGVFGPSPIPWLGFATLDCPIVLPDLHAVLRVGPDIFERQPGFDPAWLTEFEVPDVRWVAAAEIDGWLPDEDVRYVGLRSDLSLASALVERDGELVDVLKQQPCAPGQCDPLPAPQLLRAAALGADPRVLVLSARRRTLFAIERESTDGERRRVRALDLVARRWHGLDEEGAPLGHVLAATYSAPDDALYVLDEVPGRPGRSRARLVRVELELGATRGAVLAEWPRATTNDRFALTVDPAGALYLAGTQASGRLSVVVRLERGRRGEYEPTGFVLRAERFIDEGLRANERGVTLVLDDPIEGALPIAIGFDELIPGRGGIVRCL